jgi:membrane fusion protein (multidrug efflux system)
MKKFIASVFFCGVIVALGLGAVMFSKQVRAEDAQQQQGAMAQAKVEQQAKVLPLVNVQIMKAQTLEDSVDLTGALEPWERVTLSAETRGAIEWRGVEEGDVVKAGQPLFKIDRATIEAALDQGLAQQKLAGQDMDRVTGMSKAGIVAKQEMDRATAQRDVAEANVRQLKIQLDKSTVTASISGIVDELMKKKGEFTEAGMPLVTIVQVDAIKARMGLPERDVQFFKKGDAVRISLDAYPDRTFPGAIHRIATTAEQTTRTFITEVKVDNPDGFLKPGMVARATFVRQSFADSMLVPIFSVISLDDKRLVAIEENGVARARIVETGLLKGDMVQITKGLSPGDRLIVKGQRDLKEGAPVQVDKVIE